MMFIWRYKFTLKNVNSIFYITSDKYLLKNKSILIFLTLYIRKRTDQIVRYEIKLFEKFDWIIIRE